MLALLLLWSLLSNETIGEPGTAYIIEAILLVPFFAVIRASAKHQITWLSGIALLTLLSTMIILIFARIYFVAQALDQEIVFREALYFAIVTWTTLGYGDFKPCGDFQLFAAIEAVYGYVFLGSIVGLISGSITENSNAKKDT